MGASYLANLMANINKAPSPVLTKLSIGALAGTGRAVCVLNRSSHLAFMQNTYPDVLLAPIASDSTTGLLQALRSGACVAAVAPDTGLLNAMSLADPLGQFCSLDFVTAALGSGLYAIPWSLQRVPQREVDAMSTLVAAAIGGGSAAGPGATYQSSVFDVQVGTVYENPCLPQCRMSLLSAVGRSVRS